jgi:hypothetical protein
MVAVTGCTSFSPALTAGGGLFLPSDSDVSLGWEIEVEPSIEIGPAAIPLRFSGGSAPIGGSGADLNRLGVAVLFELQEWGGDTGPAFLSDIRLMLAVGGSRIWSGDTADTAPIIGLDLQFLGIEKTDHARWVVRAGYDWMPIDITAGGENVSDAGGFSVSLLYTWW